MAPERVQNRGHTGLLVHLCGRAEWEDARQRGEVRPESLTLVGFVHLSTPGQVHLPANRLFVGRSDLCAVWVDPDELQSPLRWEPGVPGDPESMLFPHLYGPLPVAAVVAVESYRPGPDDLFEPLIHSPSR
ncbi:MAG: DUF952 domain-containing protein [Mycobacterium sp.]